MFRHDAAVYAVCKRQAWQRGRGLKTLRNVAKAQAVVRVKRVRRKRQQAGAETTLDTFHFPPDANARLPMPSAFIIPAAGLHDASVPRSSSPRRSTLLLLCKRATTLTPWQQWRRRPFSAIRFCCSTKGWRRRAEPAVRQCPSPTFSRYFCHAPAARQILMFDAYEHAFGAIDGAMICSRSRHVKIARHTAHVVAHARMPPARAAAHHGTLRNEGGRDTQEGDSSVDAEPMPVAVVTRPASTPCCRSSSPLLPLAHADGTPAYGKRLPFYALRLHAARQQRRPPTAHA